MSSSIRELREEELWESHCKWGASANQVPSSVPGIIEREEGSCSLAIFATAVHQARLEEER